MTRRPVNVEIGELVLDGLCTPRHADRVAAALTGELERLLTLEPPDAVDREVDLVGDELTLRRSAAPESIGRDAARAVHRRLVS
jgi:hypothetical protein